MAKKNEFKAFAIGENANVLKQSEYEVMPALGAGFSVGTAESIQLNKVWRQSSVMASVLANFISEKSNDDVLDDGDLLKLQTSLQNALINYSKEKLDSRYWPTEVVGTLSDGGTFASCNKIGVYLVNITQPATVSDMPSLSDGAIYSYGMLIVTKFQSNVISQLYVNHVGQMANRQTWAGEGKYNPWIIQFSTKDKPKASDVTGLIDSIYPVGIVTWFAQNKNPNQLFPGTTWKYIGENRTIRLGKQDGTDLMQTGGADSVTLNSGNMPAHNHSFAADTSWFDYGTKLTSADGAHGHGLDVRVSNVASETSSFSDVVKTGGGTTFYTSTDGLHSHRVDIGGHNHSVSGTTGSSGGGSAFSIINPYIKLMGWYRSA